jgi:hypothetical protein
MRQLFAEAKMAAKSLTGASRMHRQMVCRNSPRNLILNPEGLADVDRIHQYRQ